MRKIINSTYLSLDGVVEAPHLWPSHGGQSDERAGRIQTDLLLSCDAVLMGRHTYDGFAPVWPTRSGDPYSDRINAMRKYVVSTTLRDPDWNNTEVIDGDVAAAIARLKEEPGQDIVQYGYGEVTRLMLEHGLPTLASRNHTFDHATPIGPGYDAYGAPAPPRDGLSAISDLTDLFDLAPRVSA